VRVSGLIGLFGDIEDTFLIPNDVVWSTHAGPHGDEFSFWREYLDPAIGPVANVHFALWINQKAVDQVEFSGGLLAGLSPRVDEKAILAKPVYASVPVSI
jgi:hypothetical protein